jgi:broad specificity phosphatase PhoE
MESAVLVRHGFAVSNRDGVASCAVPGGSLMPEGIAQAKELAVALSDEPFSLGISSELARTRETLAWLLDGREVSTITLGQLNEIDFGSFAEGPLDDYRAWAASHHPDVPAPGGGDSRATAAARFARGLRAVLARPEERILLVWHALALRYVLDAVDGLAPAALITPVPHAVAHTVGRADLGRAAALLEEWSRAPHFRDPSIEARASLADVRPRP